MDKLLKAKGEPLPIDELFKFTRITRADLEGAIADAPPVLRKFLRARP